MPLYEYQCKKCAHRFEKILKFSDKHISKCPKCGSKVELVISAPAVQFKGSGWYVTDYARKPTAHSTAATSSEDKKPKAEDASSDSKVKPEKKTEKKKP